MTTRTNPLWPILDAVGSDLRSHGPREAVRRLAGSLAHSRTQIPFEAWKGSCAAIGSHPALSLLLEDPYTRDARTKPAGYAGDARTLDYVYLRDPGSQPITRAGRALFDVTTGVPVADAVRERSAVLGNFIERYANDRPIAVASIACGHVRELDQIPETTRRRIRFWGIDHDAKSVDHCRSRFDTAQVRLDVGSVRDLLANRVRIPNSDVVYASGLFDYLDQRCGSVLLKRMFASVNVGGTLVIPNLSPRNDESGYMEAVMDWWMCYRTESDMRELASMSGFDPDTARITTSSTSDNRIVWLQIDRVAALKSCTTTNSGRANDRQMSCRSVDSCRSGL